MRGIKCNAGITSISARAEGSLGMRIVTSKELTPEEKTSFFDLQNVECEMLLVPIADPESKVITIDSKLDEKSPSQRLRSVLYVYWKQNGLKKDFATFYKEKMEGIIEMVKSKLDPAN